jgi:hypothetical protein
MRIIIIMIILISNFINTGNCEIKCLDIS